MRSRTEFPQVLLNLGLTGTIVEVGTYKGEFAHHVLSHWPGTLYCVDAWTHQDGQQDILNHAQPEMDAVYAEALARLQPFEHRCAVIKNWSLDAARRFAIEEEAFDAVYLDAAHDVGSVTQDLAAWWPLVKDGGLFAGHDYLQGTRAEGYPADFGVKEAVDAFVHARQLDLQVTSEDQFPTWWIHKPQTSR